MSKLIDGLKSKDTYTANGALTNSSSLNSNVDFFFLAGASRHMNDRDIVNLFTKAFAEDRMLAMRILLWARDVRGGAGERRLFRIILDYIAKNDVVLLHKLLPYVAEYGRWDDVLGENILKYSIPYIRERIKSDDKESLGLLFKWLPREKSSRSGIARRMRIALGLSRKQYRKLLAENSSTVEQLMSAKDWDNIKYSSVPSKAFNLYRKAFLRNDESRFNSFLESVEQGESKINAKAIFPVDIYRSFNNGGDNKSINLQWDALPNYLEGNNESILPVCDTSGSMSGEPMDVSISLGVYLSERMGGLFKDNFITFEGSPKLQSLKGTTTDRFRQINRMSSDCGTNLVGVFELLLDVAKRNNLKQEDLPTKLLIISDMEFNSVGSRYTNLEYIRILYRDSGYEMPGIIFWNVNGRVGNVPAQVHDKGVALVSGYSPAIVKAILGGEDLTPVGVMKKAVNVPRYDVVKELV